MAGSDRARSRLPDLGTGIPYATAEGIQACAPTPQLVDEALLTSRAGQFVSGPGGGLGLIEATGPALQLNEHVQVVGHHALVPPPVGEVADQIQERAGLS